jgi:hypothetical protein
MVIMEIMANTQTTRHRLQLLPLMEHMTTMAATKGSVRRPLPLPLLLPPSQLPSLRMHLGMVTMVVSPFAFLLQEILSLIENQTMARMEPIIIVSY